MRADLVITGGVILTMVLPNRADDASLSEGKGAVAVESDRIVAVGSEAEIRSLVDDRTQVLDLGGRTLLPGFIDTHVHLVQTGLGLRGPDLSDCRSVKQVLEQVRESFSDRPIDQPIFFHRCSLAGLDRLLTRWDLDRIAPHTPLGVGDIELNRCVVNTAALEAMGLAPTTPGIDRTAQGGQPTGLMTNQAHTIARSFFYNALDDKARIEALHLACELALRAGATTVHAIEGREAFGSRDLPLLLIHRDRLPVRVVLYSQSTELSKAAVPGVQGVTDLWADGSYIDRTAALLEPYADDVTTCGRLYFAQDELDRLLFRAHSLGLQVGFHAIGDAAIEQVLNAYERILAAEPGFAEQRPRIEHFSLPSERQIECAVQLGVGVSMQPVMSAGPQRTVTQRLGPERSSRRHPYRKIVDAGLLVAGGSDSDVTPINPLAGINALVNPLEADRRLSVVEALAVFTVNGAKLAKEDKLKGTLEPGKLADMVVLGLNPMAVDPGQLGSIPIDMTIVGGQIRWVRPEGLQCG